MKILQLAKYYPPIYGGIEIVAEFFSRALVNLGHSIDIISVGDEGKNYTGTYGEKVWQCKEDINLRSAPISASYLWRFKKHIQKQQINYILVHLPNPFAHEVIKLFSRVIKDKNIKVIGIYHSDIINQQTFRETYNFYFKQHGHLYHQFYCSSQNLKKSSSILSELPEDKVKIIPFCIDHLAHLATPISEKKFHGKYITVGRMVPYKGFGFLIDCFSKLPFELTIVGNGPLRNELMHHCPPNVHFVGEVSEEEKYKLFAASDALIVASTNRAEAYGMTIVEAFSVGLPVISSDVDTGVTYLVQEKITGLTFPILDSKVFNEKIFEFSNKEELRQQLATNCFDFYLKNLSFETFQKNLAQLIPSEMV